MAGNTGHRSGSPPRSTVGPRAVIRWVFSEEDPSKQQWTYIMDAMLRTLTQLTRQFRRQSDRSGDEASQLRDQLEILRQSLIGILQTADGGPTTANAAPSLWLPDDQSAVSLSGGLDPTWRDAEIPTTSTAGTKRQSDAHPAVTGTKKKLRLGEIDTQARDRSIVERMRRKRAEVAARLREVPANRGATEKSIDGRGSPAEHGHGLRRKHSQLHAPEEMDLDEAATATENICSGHNSHGTKSGASEPSEADSGSHSSAPAEDYADAESGNGEEEGADTESFSAAPEDDERDEYDDGMGDIPIPRKGKTRHDLADSDHRTMLLDLIRTETMEVARRNHQIMPPLEEGAEQSRWTASLQELPAPDRTNTLVHFNPPSQSCDVTTPMISSQDLLPRIISSSARLQWVGEDGLSALMEKAQAVKRDERMAHRVASLMFAVWFNHQTKLQIGQKTEGAARKAVWATIMGPGSPTRALTTRLNHLRYQLRSGHRWLQLISEVGFGILQLADAEMDIDGLRMGSVEAVNATRLTDWVAAAKFKDEVYQFLRYIEPIAIFRLQFNTSLRAIFEVLGDKGEEKALAKDNA